MFFYRVIFLFLLVSLPGQVLFAQSDVLSADNANQLRVLTHLLHPSTVAEGYFSPTGRWFVSGALDQKLRLWDGTSGAPELEISGYIPGATTTAFSADETQIAASTAAAGTGIEVYSIPNAELLTTFSAHTIPIKHVYFLDGAWLSSDLGDLAYLWDETDLLAEYPDIAEVQPAPDGKGFALVGRDGKAVFIRLAAPTQQNALPINQASHLSFSPGGRWLAVWGSGGALVWDVREETALFQLANRDIDLVQWSPDGRFLIAQSFSGAEVWSIEGMQTGVFALEEAGGGLKQLALSADGRRAATVDYIGNTTAILWSLDENGVVQSLRPLTSIIDEVAFSPDSQTLVVTRRDFRARFWDTDQGVLRNEVALPESLIFSPDWRRIASIAGSVITWRGLVAEGQQFAFAPIGYPFERANVRPTPSDELPRVAVLERSQAVFATGRTTDWLRVITEDGGSGWVNRAGVRLIVPESDLANLPLVEFARTLPQEAAPFVLMPTPEPLDPERGLLGCAERRLVEIRAGQTVDEIDYLQVDCGSVGGWLPATLLDLAP